MEKMAFLILSVTGLNEGDGCAHFNALPLFLPLDIRILFLILHFILEIITKKLKNWKGTK
jgi:hypothetical protein